MNSALFTPMPAADSELGAVGWSPDALTENSSTPSDSPQHLVIIDGGLEQISTLVETINTRHIVVLDPQQDGMAQITTILGQYAEQSTVFQSLQIISHGSAGTLQLGNAQLSTSTVDAYGDALTEWGSVLVPGGDVLVYGCDVGAGASGMAFADALSTRIGADVAVSTDLTGHIDQGGDWDLEYATGLITGESLEILDDGIATYNHTLNTPVQLGNGTTTGGTLDPWRSNLIINKTDIYTNTSGAAQDIRLDTFNFYAQKRSAPITPFVVKVNGENNFTVVAVGTGRTQSNYQLGNNAIAFNNGSARIITLQPGESIAPGFLDAQADGADSKKGAVVPYDTAGSVDAVWITGGKGGGSQTGTVTEGAAPGLGAKVLPNENRNYHFNIDVTVLGDVPPPPPNQAPELAAIASPLSVQENTTTVTNVNASDDRDSEGNGLTYAISGTDADQFTLNVTTGALAFASAPDFEAPQDDNGDNRYELTVTVTDADGASDAQPVLVDVTDVDETLPNSSPVLTPVATPLSLEENTVSVVDFEATDDRNSEGAGLTYRLSGPDANRFDLNTATGELDFLTAPDFETPQDANQDNQYEITVEVEDADGATDSQALVIQVTDVDETPPPTNTPPTITSNNGQPTASLSVDENTTAVTNINASDIDGDTEGNGLTYSLGGPDASQFTLNQNTGAIAFESAPDFENPQDAGTNNTYNVTVTVTDSQGATDQQAIAIQVQDVDETPEPPPEPGTTINLGNPSTSGGTLDEWRSNLVINETDIYTNTSNAPQDIRIDQFKFYAQRRSAPVTPFIVEVNGDNDFTVIAVGTSFTKNDYQVGSNALAFNQGSPKTITVAPGATIAAGFLDAAANGANSKRGAVIPYTNSAPDELWITGGPGGGSQTGTVTEGQAPGLGDRVLTSIRRQYFYSIDITVVDDGPPPPNQAPVITSNSGAESATISVDDGTITVIDIAATDPDGDTEGNGLSYTLSGTDADQFTISNTGAIRFATAADHGAPADANGDNSYQLTVTVTDSQGATDSQDLAITVLAPPPPQNQPPVITSNNGTNSATLLVNEGTVVVTDINATDPDGDTEGNGLSYALAGPDADQFTVSNTGDIRFTSAADYEAPTDANGDNSYDVTVTVTDSQGATDSQDLTIQVQDIDDSPGSLQFFSSSFGAEEADGTVEITVSRMGGSTGTVSVDYETLGGFAIGGEDYLETSGTLTFADGETSQSFQVQLLDDSEIEGDETFSVGLSNAIGADLGTQATAIVTINNDDGPMDFPDLTPVLPTGFIAEEVDPGAEFSGPTGLKVAPDGRIFVTEKDGKVFIVENGQKLETPFLDLSSEVQSQGFSQGLAGFAFDPNFEQNGYVYLFYTTTENGESFGRLSRFTASDTNPNQADLSSRLVLLGQNAGEFPFGDDIHLVGDLKFGADGTLLISHGDGAGNKFDDTDVFNAQDLSNLAGAISRVDPATGLGLPSNPFFTGDPSDPQSKIWVFGLRNPYRFEVRDDGSPNPADGNPGTLYIGDVGRGRFEELNIATGGENFGWPYFQGTATYQPGGDAITQTGPAIAWAHNFGQTSIGGAFYNGDQFPTEYQGKYFHADYTSGWIRLIEVDANNTIVSEEEFATGVTGITDLEYDPVTKQFYFVALNQAAGFRGELYTIRYDGV